MFYLEDELDEENESSKLLQSFDEINKERSFIVYSLGSMDFDEQKLTELSSKAIQKCIIELTTKGEQDFIQFLNNKKRLENGLTVSNSLFFKK